jgi:predicted O-methyltransferase YrrM
MLPSTTDDIDVPATTRSASFEEALGAIDGVEGWLSEEQARVLHRHAAHLPAGSRIVEIGSHHGRSTIVLALGAEGAEIVAIDPFGRPERPVTAGLTDAEVGERDLRTFEANLERAGVRERVQLVRADSSDALRLVHGAVDLLYVDGAHEFRPANSDLREWGARVRPGGTMLVHDAFSSVGVTLAQVVSLFLSEEFRYVGRTGSLAQYTRERVPALARVPNALRQGLQLPWFARNVAVKAAILTGLRPVARLLGHTDETFPH